MINVIKIGTSVTVLNKINGMINQISIKPKNQILYLIAYVDEDKQYKELWVYEHEITSEHTKKSIVHQSIT